MLRAEIQAFNEKRAASGMKPVHQVSIAEARRRTMPTEAMMGVPEPIYSVQDRFIPGPTSYLPIRIYRPSAAENLPVMVFFHGGGWALGNLDGYEQALRAFANKINTVVISVFYQKAPEHPFPIPFDDCYATFQWVVENAGDLKIDISKLGIAGDSAGGNLAAAVCLKNRDENFADVLYQLLIYPGLDDNLDTESMLKNGAYGLSREDSIYFFGMYAGNADRNNPYLLPLKAKDFSGLPTTIMMVAEYDIIRDDGIAYKDKLEAAGIEVLFRNYLDSNHGTLLYAGFSDLALKIQADLSADVKSILVRK